MAECVSRLDIDTLPQDLAPAAGAANRGTRGKAPQSAAPGAQVPVLEGLATDPVRCRAVGPSQVAPVAAATRRPSQWEVNTLKTVT